MPKRLSDLTHSYERTFDDLEDAEDTLTSVVQAHRTKVDGASRAHQLVRSELLAYLRAHPDEVVIANDKGFHFDPHVPGSIRIRPIYWAHHIWLEDQPQPEPEARYVVGTLPEKCRSRDDNLAAMATAWGDVESNGEPCDYNPGD